MGYSKVIKIAPGKVKVVHQLGSDGKAYAEDVTFESEVPDRLEYLESQDGKIGILNFGFTPLESQPEGIQFPGDDLTTATPPPVNNEHTAPGTQPFSPEVIAANEEKEPASG